MGNVSRRRRYGEGNPREDLVVDARRPERDPARRQGDRHLPQNVFIVRDGTIYTPDLSASILPGITRDTIIQIAQDLGYTVVEKQLIRTDLYLADEVFMTGTAAEVTPLREVDDQPIGPPGPVTLAIQKAYLDTVRGLSERWSHWLEYASTEPARAQA